MYLVGVEADRQRHCRQDSILTRSQGQIPGHRGLWRGFEKVRQQKCDDHIKASRWATVPKHQRLDREFTATQHTVDPQHR